MASSKPTLHPKLQSHLKESPVLTWEERCLKKQPRPFNRLTPKQQRLSPEHPTMRCKLQLHTSFLTSASGHCTLNKNSLPARTRRQSQKAVVIASHPSPAFRESDEAMLMGCSGQLILFTTERGTPTPPGVSYVLELNSRVSSCLTKESCKHSIHP